MSCLRRARGAGRTKPPEEHYAEAEGSSGRWTKAFPARRIYSRFAAGKAGTFALSSLRRAYGSYGRTLGLGPLFSPDLAQSKRSNAQFELV
jgi:hypothetical protein